MGTPIASLPIMESEPDDVDTLLSQMDNQSAPRPPPRQDVPPPQRRMEQPQRVEQYNDMPRVKRSKKVSLSDRIFKEGKVPFIVALLFFILNLSMIDTQLTSRFARLVNDDTGDLNYFGVALKALVMGVLYYVVKMFV